MSDAFKELSPDDVAVVSNVRKRFDEEKLGELAASIREHGIIEPLIVRRAPERDDGRYELVAGERRYRAAKLAGLAEIPVRIMDLTREQAAKIQLLENLQRQDLDPVEEAAGFRALLDEHGYTQETLAGELGVSQPHVANRLSLLRLPEEVQEGISRGMISATTGRELLRLERWPKLLVQVAKQVQEQELSTRDVPGCIESHVVDYGRNLDPKSYWPQPLPVFDVSECKECDDRFKASRSYLCMNKQCWGRRQGKAEKEREAAKRAAAPVPAGGDQPHNGFRPTGAAQATMEREARAKAVQEKLSAMLKKAGPAAPPESADLILPHVWTSPGKDFGRECFLPLGQLLQHFDDRHKLGATSMPHHLGSASVLIPEQGVEFHGQWGHDGGSKIVFVDAGAEIHTPGGSLGDDEVTARTSVYYRVAISDLTAASCHLDQWVAVRGRDRTIIVRASATVTAQRDIKTRWLKLINQLPAFPGTAVDLPNRNSIKSRLEQDGAGAQAGQPLVNFLAAADPEDHDQAEDVDDVARYDQAEQIVRRA